MSSGLHIGMADHVSDIGGAELSMEGLLINGTRRGLHFTVFLPGRGPLFDRLSAASLKICTNRLDSWRWWTKSCSDRLKLALSLPLQFINTLRWAWMLKSENIDILHCNINRLVEPVIAAALLRLPTVMHYRDIPSRIPLQFALGECGFYMLMNLATHWIANSRATYHDIINKARCSVTYVPNGVDLQMFNCEPFKAIERQAACFTLAMVAGIVPWKNYADYIRVCGEVRRRRKDVRFLAIGGGDITHLTDLQDLARSIGLGESLHFTGYVTDVPRRLREIDILVHTTDREPFGRVFIEAMAARKPVVGVNSGGAVEVVDHGVTGTLHPPGAVGSMAESICSLLDDPCRRIAFGEAGRRKVESSYGIERHCQEIEKVYDKLYCPGRNDVVI